MSFIRSTSVFISTNLLIGFLVLAALTYSLGHALGQPGTVKAWVKNSGAYERLIPSMLESIDDPVREPGTAGLANDPGVRAAAEQAFTPDVLQQSTEKFIDNTYRWLNGEAERPTFVLDLTPAQERFADSLAVYLHQRWEQLPACTSPEQLSGTTDLLSAECRAPGYNPDADIGRLAQQIAQFDASNLPASSEGDASTQEGTQPGSPAIQPWEGMRLQYRLLKTMPYIFGALALLTALFILFVSKTRRRGLVYTGMASALAALLLSGLMLLSGLILDLLGNYAARVSPGMGTAFQEIGMSLTMQLEQAMRGPNLRFATAYATLAALLFLAALLLRPRRKPAPAAAPAPPAPAPAAPPARPVEPLHEARPEPTTAPELKPRPPARHTPQHDDHGPRQKPTS